MTFLSLISFDQFLNFFSEENRNQLLLLLGLSVVLLMAIIVAFHQFKSFKKAQQLGQLLGTETQQLAEKGEKVMMDSLLIQMEESRIGFLERIERMKMEMVVSKMQRKTQATLMEDALVEAGRNYEICASTFFIRNVPLHQ
jgi:Tfp pilus assembly protein PilN